MKLLFFYPEKLFYTVNLSEIWLKMVPCFVYNYEKAIAFKLSKRRMKLVFK